MLPVGQFIVVVLLVGQVSCGPLTTEKTAEDEKDKDAKCLEDLGCFPITPDFFHPLYRPVNFQVAERKSINTKFLVYTRKEPKTEFRVRTFDKTSLAESGFNATKKTKLIVHGFIHKRFREWLQPMKDEYLLNGDYNVIIVDWSGGNNFPYTQATSNTRVVGAEIALLLQWLKETENLKLEDCHIIGHSLGAHVAGYAGERLNKLGRITAMDPAEPYFQNLPPSVRLDPTDADFVDVIHADSRTILLNGLGMSQHVGHVDFFPNAGYKQPGCDESKIFSFITEGLTAGIGNILACNHLRAVDFQMESINHQRCVFTGFACPDWDTFLHGKCASCGPKGEKCALMGEKAQEYYYKFRNDSRQQAFYLKTGAGAPFCLFHYQVTVKLQDSNANDQEGILSLTLRGDKDEESYKLQNGEKIKLYHGSSYTFLITTSNFLGQISGATFSWDGGFQLFPWPKKLLYLHSIKIAPINMMDSKFGASLTKNFCATKSGVESRKELTFTSSGTC